MATAREQIEAAMLTKGWTVQRKTTSSTFGTKLGTTNHSTFAIFNRSGQLVVAFFDGVRLTGVGATGQLVTKINAT